MSPGPRALSHSLGVSYFVHPLPLSAVALLILNDHWLKSRYPGVLTGKLSDAAGLFFFPLFLTAVFCLSANVASVMAGRRRFYWIGPRLLQVSIAATVTVFTLTKITDWGGGFYLAALHALGFPSRLTQDPTDLAMLPFAGLSFIYARRFWADAPDTQYLRIKTEQT